jgi:hypothetical protein
MKALLFYSRLLSVALDLSLLAILEKKSNTKETCTSFDDLIPFYSILLIVVTVLTIVICYKSL